MGITSSFAATFYLAKDTPIGLKRQMTSAQGGHKKEKRRFSE